VAGPSRNAAFVAAVLTAAAAAAPAGLRAQTRDYRNLRWWHPLAATAGVAALFLVDEPVRDYVQDHRSASLDDMGDVAVTFHDPKVFIVSGTGAMALGLLVRSPRVAEAGLQILASYGLVSGMMIGAKWLLGRSRPNTTPEDPTAFHMLGGGESASLPSGASAVTFSLATTVADAVGHPAVSVVLYGAATLNAWARVNADRHWVSDVAAGALFGVTAAKLVNGRWRIFGFRPPTVLVDPAGRAAVAYSLTW
jgi:membrane-associated phospholipid phosphatase